MIREFSKSQENEAVRIFGEIVEERLSISQSNKLMKAAEKELKDNFCTYGMLKIHRVRDRFLALKRSISNSKRKITNRMKKLERFIELYGINQLNDVVNETQKFKEDSVMEVFKDED